MKVYFSRHLKKIVMGSAMLIGVGSVYADLQPNNEQNSIIPNAASPDAVISQYTANQKGPIRKITVINNTAQTIYPALRVFNLNDNHEYRIYIGHYTENGNFALGIPPANSFAKQSNKATVYVPPQMWNAARIEMFTDFPPIPGAGGVNKAESTALFAFDANPNSLNYGDLIYRNDKPDGFALDVNSQLVEYTFDATTVDYDVSYVDHLFLPVALEVDGGIMGYMGSGMTLPAMQNQLHALAQGQYTQGYFNATQNMGWPSFYNPDVNASFIKIPAAYNIFALSSLADVRSTFDQNRYMLITNLSNDDAQVLDGVVNRWLGWVQPNNYQGNIPAGAALNVGYFANSCNGDTFCTAFADTVNRIWPVAWKATQEKFPKLTHDQLTFKVVEEILGYDFSAEFNHDNPIYADNKDSFRDAVKSVLRGVPYPFWNYPESQWYPNPSATLDGQANPKQKYNLDPIVWFVHKQLGMAGYGFSIDDDTGNVQAPGTSLTIAVGGLQGLKNKNQYNPNTQQAVLIADGWTELTSTNLGGCVLQAKTGTDCPISLNPKAASNATVNLSTADGMLSFTLGYGKVAQDGSYPLVMTQCKVTGNLDTALCAGDIMRTDPNQPRFFDVPAPRVSPNPPPVDGNYDLTGSTLGADGNNLNVNWTVVETYPNAQVGSFTVTLYRVEQDGNTTQVSQQQVDGNTRQAQFSNLASGSYYVEIAVQADSQGHVSKHTKVDSNTVTIQPTPPIPTEGGYYLLVPSNSAAGTDKLEVVDSNGVQAGAATTGEPGALLLTIPTNSNAMLSATIKVTNATDSTKTAICKMVMSVDSNNTITWQGQAVANSTRQDDCNLWGSAGARASNDKSKPTIIGIASPNQSPQVQGLYFALLPGAGGNITSITNITTENSNLAPGAKLLNVANALANSASVDTTVTIANADGSKSVSCTLHLHKDGWNADPISANPGCGLFPISGGAPGNTPDKPQFIGVGVP